MKIHLQTKILLAIICFSASFGNLFSQTSHNVLFIAVDDLKPLLGCYGDTKALTPNIDQLAAQGTLFLRPYCQQALCGPSRASVLTGMYPDQLGITAFNLEMRALNPDLVTLPEYLKNQGYFTRSLGKVYDGRNCDGWGTQDSDSWSIRHQWGSGTKNLGYYASDTAHRLHDYLVSEGLWDNTKSENANFRNAGFFPSVEAADVDDLGYQDGGNMAKASQFLTELKNTGDPFFFAVGFVRPHLPFAAPKKYWDMYNREEFTVASFQDKAANSPELAYHTFGELREYSDIPAQGPIDTTKQLELIHGYYATTSYVDAMIGKMIDTLEYLGLRESTTIILWGDHGFHLGDHDLWCKHSNFEQAVFSPLIISHPGQANQGENYPFPVELIDIAPTVCEALGIDVPETFAGKSLMAAVINPEQPIRETALSQYPKEGSMGYSVRSERYRYTKWVKVNTHEVTALELYDYQTDPLETISVHEDEAYAEVVHRMDSIVNLRMQCDKYRGLIDTVLIPGQIQAEAYHLMEGIDVQATEDAGEGLDIGQVNSGDWTEYYIEVPESRDYEISYRIATANSAAGIDLYAGDELLSHTDLPSTGGIQSWQTIIADTIALEEGIIKIRLEAESGGYNLNWFELDTVKSITSNQHAQLLDSEDLKIYPNPTGDRLVIELEPHLSNCEVSLFTLSGNEVKRENIDSRTTKILDVSSIRSGVYLLCLTSGPEKIYRKMIKL